MFDYRLPNDLFIQATLPRLKAMTWNMSSSGTETLEPVAVINLRVFMKLRDIFSRHACLDIELCIGQYLPDV